MSLQVWCSEGTATVLGLSAVASGTDATAGTDGTAATATTTSAINAPAGFVGRALVFVPGHTVRATSKDGTTACGKWFQFRIDFDRKHVRSFELFEAGRRGFRKEVWTSDARCVRVCVCVCVPVCVSLCARSYLCVCALAATRCTTSSASHLRRMSGSTPPVPYLAMQPTRRTRMTCTAWRSCAVRTALRAGVALSAWCRAIGCTAACLMRCSIRINSGKPVPPSFAATLARVMLAPQLVTPGSTSGWYRWILLRLLQRLRAAVTVQATAAWLLASGALSCGDVQHLCVPKSQRMAAVCRCVLATSCC